MKTLVIKALRTLRSRYKSVSRVMATEQFLTKHLTSQRAFKKDPFYLLDVGSSGGISHLWDLLGKDLAGYGFDPLVNECERLNKIKKHHHFEYIPSFVISGIPEIDQFEKGVYRWFGRSSAAKVQKNYVKETFNHGQELVYAKEKTSLDQFCADRKIEKVDFVKIDTDGFDYKVLRGAEKILSKETTLGTLVECNFTGNPGPHENCFRNIEGFLAEKGYRVFDMEVNRYTKHHLPGVFSYQLAAQTQRGQACWGDVLFLRDFVEQKDNGISVSPSSLLKMASLMELFKLPDCAAELIKTFESDLQPIIDVKKFLDLLAQDMGLFNSYESHIHSFTHNVQSFYP